MQIPPFLNFRARSAYFQEQIQTLGRSAFEKSLISLAEKIGMERFRRQAADDLLEATRPAETLPDVYAAYKPVVTDGVRFILSRVSLDRLTGLVSDQAELAPDAPPARRLLSLARRLPTFHKLGQIIARNRRIDPAFKQWLVQLENSPASLSITEIKAMVRDALGAHEASFGVTLGQKPLAEASVGVAIPFYYTSQDGVSIRSGVFKILKPGIREHLTEELGLLDDLAHHLEARRDRYQLDRFRFIDVFGEVRRILMEEIDLPGEQRNLIHAARFYGQQGNARAPGLLPFSTNTMTAMEFLEGDKITDAPATAEECCRLARTLFKSLILMPLFSMSEASLFHGDPHAGNLLATRADQPTLLRVGLIDWSLSGQLSRPCRTHLVALMRGVTAGDSELMITVVRRLSAGDDSPAVVDKTDSIGPAIQDIMAGDDYRKASVTARTFAIIDGLALAGIPFPSDLMLFRKAFFTLDGVIADLDPDFDMDVVMAAELARLLAAETPQRCLAWLFPFMDRAENYRTLLSNQDLRWLMARLLADLARKGIFLTVGAAFVGVSAFFPFINNKCLDKTC